MAADYQEGVCPPHTWVWDRVGEEIGVPKAHWSSDDWTPVRSSLNALASYIWKREEPPVDPAMDAVREALAAYEDASGFKDSAALVRNGQLNTRVNAVVASLRASGVLK